LVIIQNDELVTYQPFISRGTASLTDLRIDRMNLWGGRRSFDETAQRASDAYRDFLNKQSHGEEVDPNIYATDDKNNIVIDRCMVYASKKSNDDYFSKHEYYHLPLYHEMLTKYLENRRAKVGGLPLNRIFFMNVMDHPVIVKDVLDTHFVLSNDAEPDYSDLPFPYADVWLMHSKLELSKGNHYAKIQAKIDEFRGDDFLLTDAVLDARKQKVIFRGSLTGCNPDDISSNLRLSTFNAAKRHNEFNPDDSTRYFDVEITGLFKGIIANNDRSILFGKEDYYSVLGRDNLENDGGLRRHFKDVGDIMFGHRYVISIDGYVSPWRLPIELLFGNIVFYFSEYQVWFQSLLRDCRIGSETDDGECNIFTVRTVDEVHTAVVWLEKNDDRRRLIAKRAHALGKRILKEDTIYNGLEFAIQKTPVY